MAKKACQAIGLIGGLGPGATIHYYERLTREFEARGVTPRFLISHADLKFVLERVGAGALDVRGQPLAVRERDHPVLVALPDGDRRRVAGRR